MTIELICSVSGSTFKTDDIRNKPEKCYYHRVNSNTRIHRQKEDVLRHLDYGFYCNLAVNQVKKRFDL